MKLGEMNLVWLRGLLGLRTCPELESSGLSAKGVKRRLLLLLLLRRVAESIGIRRLADAEAPAEPTAEPTAEAAAEAPAEATGTADATKCACKLLQATAGHRLVLLAVIGLGKLQMKRTRASPDRMLSSRTHAHRNRH